ncbi:hypothetical protein [Streptomyces plumbiresistens]|uniref:hypothetical protein n=1 Tax=Streptomyces plumbiresistens TaxID=511811 RepID=UPI0031F1A967
MEPVSVAIARAEAVHAAGAGAAGSCSIDQEALQGGMRKGLEICNFEPFTLHAIDGSEMTIH